MADFSFGTCLAIKLKTIVLFLTFNHFYLFSNRFQKSKIHIDKFPVNFLAWSIFEKVAKLTCNCLLHPKFFLYIFDVREHLALAQPVVLLSKASTMLQLNVIPIETTFKKQLHKRFLKLQRFMNTTGQSANNISQCLDLKQSTLVQRLTIEGTWLKTTLDIKIECPRGLTSRKLIVTKCVYLNSIHSFTFTSTSGMAFHIYSSGFPPALIT